MKEKPDALNKVNTGTPFKKVTGTPDDLDRLQPGTRSIDEIVALWQQGIDCRENFRALFGCYFRPVHTFFTRRGFSPAECDDLTQETFLRIHQLLKTYQRDTRFENWLFIITVNVYRDSVREEAVCQGPQRASDPGEQRRERLQRESEWAVNRSVESGSPDRRLIEKSARSIPTRLKRRPDYPQHTILGYVFRTIQAWWETHLGQGCHPEREKGGGVLSVGF